jgi:hypothetical protein
MKSEIIKTEAGDREEEGLVKRPRSKAGLRGEVKIAAREPP